MTLKSKAIQMRNAIDAIDLALHGDNDLQRMRELFVAARDECVIHISITAADLRQLGVAMDECNRIANSNEFIPSNLR